MPTLSCYSNKILQNDVRIATVYYQPFLGQGDCWTERMTKTLILEEKVDMLFQVPCAVIYVQNVV